MSKKARRKIIKSIQKHSIWLSLLIHSLFLASYVLVLHVALDQVPKIDPPPSYVPSYTQNNPVESPPVPKVPPVPEKQETPTKSMADKTLPQHKNGIEKTKSAEPQKVAQKPTMPSEPRKVSFSRNQIPEDISHPENREPMHLVGETKIIKPLIKILAKALSEHLTYPKIAADFNLRGVVLVGFVLHPQGYVTETKIVKSSGAGVLDDAAREAVNAMSPVRGVDTYMQKPEFLVVGIIFG